jgi:flagellar hook-basal body complex protein FliE
MMISKIAPTMAPETTRISQTLQQGGLKQTSGVEKVSQSFQATLTDAVKHVNEVQHQSDDLLKGLASGEHVDLHGTMIALEKADISLRSMVSVRDKMVQAYEQIMNMTL